MDWYLVTLLKNIGENYISNIFVYNLLLDKKMGNLMLKKISIMSIITSLILLSFAGQSFAYVSPGTIYQDTVSINFRNVTVYAPAVAQTDNGYVGVISTITVSIQSNGSGRVFVDTLPLTQIDMQGSARLSVKVASTLVKNDERVDIDPNTYDYFFVVRTSSPIIGGPSAGGIMTVAVISLLENWNIDNQTVMTGMINPDGSIGPIGGILQKIDAANSVGATRFIVPKGQMTYTETVTETKTQNGWKTTSQKLVTRNVSDYALNNYGMEVVDAEDINDALLYFTGWEFPIVESEDKITTEDYVDSMIPLATTLLEDAEKSYENASDSFNSSNIPNRYPYYYKNQVTDILNNAKEKLIDSKDWFDQKVYYTSTSKSFQALIDSRFVSYACEYFDLDDENKEDYVKNLLEEVIYLNEENSNFAKNSEINGTITLQCVGAAQKRVSDAATYISNAQDNYQNQEYLTTLYQISYAMQRSKSAKWWINISSNFNDTGDINKKEIGNLAEEYIEDAQQSIVYSSVILQEMGKSSSYINEAEELIETARNNKDKGYEAAAFFESLEALIKANLALELVDGEVEQKIERANESASSSIAETRIRGIEPVLAVSYYEYAESLVFEDSFDSALVYYKYSDIIAGAIGFTSTMGGESSRYIGVPEIQISVFEREFLRYFETMIIIATLSMIGGLLLGFVIGKEFKDTKKKQPIVKAKQKKIDDYYKQNLNQYFSDDDIPRSIKEYYKKKK